MKKFRIGNDITCFWNLFRNGKAEDFAGKDIDLYLINPSMGRLKMPFAIDDNKIVFTFYGVDQEEAGAYSCVLIETHADGTYETVDAVTAFILAERLCNNTVDNTEPVSAEFASEILVGPQGESAYKAWLKCGHEGTEEDFLDWLRAPAVSAGEIALDAAKKAYQAEKEVLATNELMKLAEAGRVTAEAARVEAENSRAADENARKEAEAGRVTAETARVEAENSRVSDETARKEAEAGRVTEESARVEAENSRATDENARKEAEAGRVTAETARVEAENSRVSDETARKEAEAGRVTAETARVEAENSRATDENARKEAEAGRVTAETARVEAENSRAADENARKEAEAGRVTAETARVEAENSRVEAENSRAADENARKEAEAGRVTAETARVEAENSRVSDETARKEAEAGRVTAESARVEAENSRAADENARKEAEAGRVTAEAARVEAEVAREELAAAMEIMAKEAKSIAESANTTAADAESNSVTAKNTAAQAAAAATKALTEVQGKQDKLTAGTGIAIENNEIKVTLDTTIYKIVESLPATPSPGNANKIHLVLSTEGEEGNSYSEYLFTNGQWEQLGTYIAKIDLTPYLKKIDAAATYLTKTAAAATYQPKGNYLTAITKAQVEAVLTGNITTHTHNQYLTDHQSLAAYLTKTDAAATYQPKGSYLTAITKAQVEEVLTGNIASHTHTFASLTSKPTTLSGYGITDAKISNGVITLGGNTITPLTSHQSITHLLRIDGTNGTAAGLTALINKLGEGDSNMTDATMLVTSHATTPGGNNYYRRPASFLWGYVKGKADAVYLLKSSYTASDVLSKIKTVDGSGSGLDADLLDGIHGAGYCRAYSGNYQFGSSNATITTAEFVEKLKTLGAFNQPYWMAKGSWYYAGNNIISDTGIGNIQLAGAVVEVMGTSNAYTIRITTAPATTNGIANAVYIYRNHGNDYNPGWKRLANTDDAVAYAVELYTPRTLTIGSTGKTFNGSANVSWSLAEIGAAAAGHTHSQYLTTITKAQIEAVLTGNITTHTHSQYLTTHQAVSNKAATLAWNTAVTVATVGATDITVKLPGNPNVDTKNTAGSTDTASKIFLIGATSQAASPQTYSHDTAYVGTDGCLYSGGAKVLTAHQSLAAYLTKTDAAATYQPKGSYLTAITKAQVEAVLTGNITTHTHSQYLTTHQAVSNKAATLAWNTAVTVATIGSTDITVKLPANPNSDTKNTAGSTDTASKIFLIGATSQAASPQTYSHDTAFVGTDGCLYSGGAKVLTAHQSLAAYITKTDAAATYQPKGSYLTAITKAQVEEVLTGDITSHVHTRYITKTLAEAMYQPRGNYLTSITKDQVEAVLTGDITTHTHTFASLTSKPTTLEGYGITDGINALRITGSGNAFTEISKSGQTLQAHRGKTFIRSAAYRVTSNITLDESHHTLIIDASAIVEITLPSIAETLIAIPDGREYLLCCRGQAASYFNVKLKSNTININVPLANILNQQVFSLAGYGMYYIVYCNLKWWVYKIA